MSEYNGIYCPMRLTGTVDTEKKQTFVNTAKKSKTFIRTWNKHHDAQLIELAQVRSFEQIAEIMGRSKDSVSNRYQRLVTRGEAPPKPTVFKPRKGRRAKL